MAHREAGVAAFRQTRYREALDRFREAYGAARQAGSSDEVRGKLLTSIGACLLGLGDYRAALAQFSEARPYTVRGANREDLAALDADIASVYLLQDDRENAARIYRRALGWLDRSPQSRHRPAILANLGAVEIRAGRYRQALRYVDEALAGPAGGEQRGQVLDLAGLAYLGLRDYDRARHSFTASLDLRQEDPSRSLLFLGRTELERGNEAEAAAKLGEAIAAARGRDSRVTLWEALYWRGLSYRRLGQPAAATEDWRESAQLLESLRAGLVPTDTLRVQFEVYHHAVYAGLAELLSEQGAMAEAFHVVEQGRAQSLRELVRGRLTTPALQLEEAQAILDPDSLLLSFYAGEKATYLWAVTSREARFYKLEWKPLVRRFLAALQQGGAEQRTLGQRLYRVLLGPIDQELLRRPHWIIAPEGDLLSLPFAALTAPSGRYLTEERALSFVPSISVLQTLRERPAPRFGREFLAVADPVLNRADPRAAGVVRCLDEAPCAPLPRLASTAVEARACARLFGPERSTLLTGLEASEDALRRAAAGSYRFWHFSSHVVVDGERPNLSFIALTLPDRLTAFDIVGLPLRAEMVTVNGCDSGTGKALPGAGVLGLARAFLAAGAQSVCATRWKIPDEGGALVERMYAHLLDRVTRAEALRRAQVEMIRAGDWRSEPRYWAAYFLVGDGGYRRLGSDRNADPGR